MTVPVPYTWEDDVKVTASLMNANVRDPLSWLMGLPTFVGWNTASTSIANATRVVMPLDTEDRKVGFTHAANDSKVYATEPGWYRWTGIVAYNPGTSYGNLGNRSVWLRKNNAAAGSEEPGGSYTGHADGTTTEVTCGGITGYVWLNGTTDYVELIAYQSSGYTLTLNTGTPASGNRTGLTLIWQGRDLA